MWQMLLVSKVLFNFLSMATITAVGMDTEIYWHVQALNGGFFQMKVVIKYVPEQEHNSSLSYLYSLYEYTMIYFIKYLELIVLVTKPYLYVQYKHKITPWQR